MSAGAVDTVGSPASTSNAAEQEPTDDGYSDSELNVNNDNFETVGHDDNGVMEKNDNELKCPPTTTMTLVEPKAMEALKCYVDNTIELLDIEHADTCNWDDVQLAPRRTVYKHFTLSGYSITSYGQMSAVFAMSRKESTHNIVLHDNVGVCLEQSKEKEHYGVVTEVNVQDRTIVVQFDRSSLRLAYQSKALFTLRVRRDLVTNKKMYEALKSLVIKPGNAADLINLRFGNSTLEEYPIELVVNTKGDPMFHNLKLTQLQKKAVTFALQKNLAIIHGPPGTGKTSTLVEIVHQLIKCNQKVLICTPSNAALDNIMERLIQFGVSMVRLGQPGRITNADIKRYSVDAILSTMQASDIIADVRSNIYATVCQLLASERQKDQGKMCHEQLSSSLGQLNRELRKREQMAIADILINAQVVCSTLSSADVKGAMHCLRGKSFDALIIDECSQAMEPLAWVAVPWAKKWILAGDHLQLAPYLTSRVAIKNGLAISLMEKLVEIKGDRSCVMLTHQFRMNSKIMSWVSKEFYNDKLVADSTVADHLLADLPGVQWTDETSTCLIFLDTSGCKFWDHQGPTLSYGNVREVEITMLMVKKLLEAGVLPNNIAVITPYRYQVDLLKDASRAMGISLGLEIQTVDGFQGQEKEAVIYTFVRSNATKQTGFISHRTRTNVAVSRARRLLCIIGDSGTLGHDSLIGSLINHIKDVGVVRSCFEFIGELHNYDPPIQHKSKSWQAKPKPAPKQEKSSILEAKELLFLTGNATGSGASTSTHIPPNPKNFVAFTDAASKAAFTKLNTDGVENKTDNGNNSAESEPEPDTVNTGSKSLLAAIEHGAIKKTCPQVKSRSKKKKHPSLPTSSAAEVKASKNTDVDDELIERLIQMNRYCQWPGCKEKVTLIYYDCQLCNQRYCLKHTLPEVHGCTLEAKKAAKKEFVHPVPKPLDEKTRQKLKAKLEQKVLSLKRGKQVSDGKKGDKK